MIDQAVDLALVGRVLGDVGQQQLVWALAANLRSTTSSSLASFAVFHERFFRPRSPREGGVRDARLGGQLFDRLAGQHPLTGFSSELTRVAKRHVHLLVEHGQILTKHKEWSSLWVKVTVLAD